MSRATRGYDDDYRRGGVPANRRPVVEDPPPRREDRHSDRTDRHRADRGQARERREIVEEPVRAERPIRSDRARDTADREDPMDYAQDTRMGGGRAENRMANTAARMEAPRETITVYRDPQTGQLRDARTHEPLDSSGRPLRPREDYNDRMMMDRDEPAPPPRRRERERDPYDSRAPKDDYDDYGRGSAKSGYNMNEYFVDGSGIEREVIQHDICRYLGNDATVRKYTKDVRTEAWCRNCPY